MSTGSASYPLDDSWVAAVHATEDDLAPLGTALVIDERRLLTSEHVVVSEGTKREPLWVAFPKAADTSDQRRRVASIVVPDRARVADLAVLVLDEPVPVGVAAAPLRCPRPGDLAGKKWWAFGFPNGDPWGNSADGVIGPPLAYGWVRMDAESRYHVEPGFSGGGLWSPDYQAVVAVVGQASGARGDGRAITLYQADACFPEEKLRLLADWTLADTSELAPEADKEASLHWRARARGVTINSERGYRFRGRSVALREITGWLDRADADRRALVVTGSPGTGKSAVLGRVVTTADPLAAADLPGSDQGVRASSGSVACAVHAKGKTALEVAAEIARAASAALPERVEDLAPMLRSALAERGRRFNVIIDALDEAASPGGPRAIVMGIVLPLVETCVDVGAQVVVGSRRADGDGDLLEAFGGALRILDLDDSRYFAADDLAAYAIATLQLTGDERPGNPYADDSTAEPIARRIAELSEANFLVAGLTARSHGLHDQEAADPARLRFTPTVDAAMRDYIHRIGLADGVPAETVLAALAFAEAPGLPMELWQAAAAALGAGEFPIRDLTRFARSSAASFLVESGGEGQAAVYRLFHQALNDALLTARTRVTPAEDDERDLAGAFTAIGRRLGWEQAPAYLLRSLASHAAHGNVIDDLLTDDGYLLHADLRRLLPRAGQSRSAAGRSRARLLRLTPRAITAGPQERAAMFSVTEVVEGLGHSFADPSTPAPYHAAWATAVPRMELATFEGHTNWVKAVCAYTQDGQPRLASASDDGAVRIWDPATGTQLAALQGPTGPVNAVCAYTQDGQPRLASGAEDQTVRIWDPATGTQLAALQGPIDWVHALCAYTQDGQPRLASGGYGRTVRIWDPATGTQLAALQGHTGPVNALCAYTQDGQPRLASGAEDQTVRIWDPATGTQLAAFEGHTGWVKAVCAYTQDGQLRLASAGDGTVRIWDPATGTQLAALQGHTGSVNALCAYTHDGQPRLASGDGHGIGGDGMVRIWDPATGTQLAAFQGHTGWVDAVCAYTQDGQPRLASGGNDRTVRIWDPAAAQLTALEGHTGPVNAVCAYTQDGQPRLASGGNDRTVQIRDPATGSQLAAFEGHTGPVNAVCAYTQDGQPRLASGGNDRTVQIRDPATGTQLATLEDHTGSVNALCAYTQDGQPRLASAGEDAMVRIWDPATGSHLATLEDHTGSVNALCAYTQDGQPRLASAGEDAMVRIWDPATGSHLATLLGHACSVNALCAYTQNSQPRLASGDGDDDIGGGGMVLIREPATSTQLAALEGHTGPVNALCAYTQDGQPRLASGGDDRTVRIWDPASSGQIVLVIPVYHRVLALTYETGLLCLALSGGMLTIQV